jgi:ATP-dependent helicase/nuclease subunit A
MRKLPPDQAAREKIAQELDINLLVEAGAGSGKTTSLVRRMIRLIESGKVQVGEIAAITFTRKAAAELRERFQNELEKAFRKCQDSGTKKLLGQALEDLDQSFMGTIHSFCAKLLRERPVEAGLDPEFTELDTVSEQLLEQQAWDQYLLGVKLNQPELLDELNNIGVSPLELKDSYQRLSCFSDVNFAYIPAAKPDLASALATLEALVYKAIKSIPKSPPDPDYDDLHKAVLRAVRLLRYLDLNLDTNIVKVLSIFAKEKKVVQKRWISKAEAVTYRDEFSQLTENVVGPVLRQWREYCHYHLMRFTLPAVKGLEELRAERSMLNFQDLLTRTASLLQNQPEVRQYFQVKYRCLLVDEFQDTDPVQAQIMFYLTGGDLREKAWQKLIPRPGSLFVVGDPKQSIYRFRRADMDTYNLVRDIISDSGGLVLELTANFRSFSTLGDWFNTVFKTLLPQEGSVYQAPFTSLDAMPPDVPGTDYGIRVLELPQEHTKKDAVVQADAERIAAYIKWALEGKLRLARSQAEIENGVTECPSPKDFMILLRYKDSIEVYARALERYGIPVSIAGGGALAKSMELRELYKLLQALQDPANQVALVAVLRGLYFGLSDSTLYAFKQAKGSFNLLSPVPQGLSSQVYETFATAFERLSRYYEWSRIYSPTVAVEKIIVDLGIVPYTLAGSLGKSRCGYVYQVLELLRKAEVDGATDFGQMVTQFGLMLEADVEEELNLAADEENAVRLMNLHKAKGLEAPVVFLAHPWKKVKRPVEEHIKFIGETPVGQFLFTRPNGEYNSEVIGQPSDWPKYELEEEEYKAAEELRLIYVAATRAKNLLVISKSLKDTEMKYSSWAPLLSDMDLGAISDEQTSTPPCPVDGGAEITLEDIEAARKGWDLANVARPTFQPVSPTGLKENYPEITLKDNSGGMAWGKVIHQVFEQLVKGTDELNATILAILTDNNQPAERLDEVLKVVEEFKLSDLWGRLSRSEVRLTEVPFSIKMEKGDPLYDELGMEGNIQFLLTGVIDLVFKDRDGWVVVDYKTNRCDSEQDFEHLTELYRGQLNTYCQVWELLTKEPVFSGELYFISLRKAKKVI